MPQFSDRKATNPPRPNIHIKIRNKLRIPEKEESSLKEGDCELLLLVKVPTNAVLATWREYCANFCCCFPNDSITSIGALAVKNVRAFGVKTPRQTSRNAVDKRSEL